MLDNNRGMPTEELVLSVPDFDLTMLNAFMADLWEDVLESSCMSAFKKFFICACQNRTQGFVFLLSLVVEIC